MEPIAIHFYTKKNCPLCDKGKAIVEELATEFPIILYEHDIYQDDQLLELYQLMIPVVEIEGEQVNYGIIKKDLLRKRLLQRMG
ncbi:glutaredoxin family protein [Bacillus sp. DJP31]|uniref:glutaredoxin family protein n=1 Tax=Bacillus sp. DJP31 TaxID=3409789 RepID=UPI003BB574BD